MNNKKFNKLPVHMAFIIDGNGRWAKKRNLIRSVGHKYGFERMIKVIKQCFSLGIKTVSIYAFSTENWNRPKNEVDYLISLFRKWFKNDYKKILEDVKINVIGEYTKFPKDVVEAAESIIKETANNMEYTLNMCINYGGRDEIIRAVNNILTDKLDYVDREVFSKYLYTYNQPDPDFIVRTSGEYRLSNFMLWQGAYSELYFPKVYWPDFTKAHLFKALTEYQKRNRRFGGIKEE